LAIIFGLLTRDFAGYPSLAADAWDHPNGRCRKAAKRLGKDLGKNPKLQKLN